MNLIFKLFISSILIFSSCFAQIKPASRDSSVQKDMVFMLHGLGRSNAAMWLLASRMEDAGFAVKRIGYPSFNKTPQEILDTVAVQINSHLPLPNNQQKVHFVGHSLGGLMIRAYLDNHKVEQLGRVVLIGTPNQGTPIIDKFRDKWWMKIAGPMTLALGTDSTSFPKSIGAPYYPLGIIAAVSENMFNNDEIIPGKDDGVVPLESAKVSGMTDIIVVKVSHTMMRYNRKVANQTKAFLYNGKFNKK
jgi:pimeloyl-ACP methyl ester carboxylesterase